MSLTIIGLTAICQSINEGGAVTVGNKNMLPTIAQVHHIIIGTKGILFSTLLPQVPCSLLLQFVNLEDPTPYSFQ